VQRFHDKVSEAFGGLPDAQGFDAYRTGPSKSLRAARQARSNRHYSIVKPLISIQAIFWRHAGVAERRPSILMGSSSSKRALDPCNVDNVVLVVALSITCRVKRYPALYDTMGYGHSQYLTQQFRSRLSAHTGRFQLPRICDVQGDSPSRLLQASILLRAFSGTRSATVDAIGFGRSQGQY
jgi:hypothetical protein